MKELKFLVWRKPCGAVISSNGRGYLLSFRVPGSIIVIKIVGSLSHTIPYNPFLSI